MCTVDPLSQRSRHLCVDDPISYVILALGRRSPARVILDGPKTATLEVPPMPIVTLPPELTTDTFDVPLLIELPELVTIPESNAPLPSI